MFDVMRQVERDPWLVFDAGHPFKGRPVVPFGFGAVFTNITRRQFDQTDLREVLPPTRCLFKDEMTEAAEAEAFRERLWAMVSPRLGPPVALPQFDRLRALLFPKVRIRQIALPLAMSANDAAEGAYGVDGADAVDGAKSADADQSTHPNNPAHDRTVQVMDLAQEQIARSLGEGHRIVRGVAGSGKTLILAFRAEHLARTATRPILMLCYANGIAGRLESTMQERGVEDRVQVSTFHAWCYRMLRTYDLTVPNEKDIPDFNARLAATVQAVTNAVSQGHIPGGQYDAVLIDEAHDFEPQWLALAAKMVHPDQRALMIVYDDMQAITKGRARPVWKTLGIEAQGRTMVLKVNYRNTVQILKFARSFAADVLNAPGVQAGDEDAALLPEDAGREGLEPEVRKCVSVEGEAHVVAEWLSGRKQAGYTWAQMAVLVPEHWIGDKVLTACKALNVPMDEVRKNKPKIGSTSPATLCA